MKRWCWCLLARDAWEKPVHGDTGSPSANPAAPTPAWCKTVFPKSSFFLVVLRPWGCTTGDRHVPAPPGNWWGRGQDQHSRAGGTALSCTAPSLVHAVITPFALCKTLRLWLGCILLYYYLSKQCFSWLLKYRVYVRLVKIKMAKKEVLAVIKFRDQILGISFLWSR